MPQVNGSAPFVVASRPSRPRSLSFPPPPSPGADFLRPRPRPRPRRRTRRNTPAAPASPPPPPPITATSRTSSSPTLAETHDSRLRPVPRASCVPASGHPPLEGAGVGVGRLTLEDAVTWGWTTWATAPLRLDCCRPGLAEHPPRTDWARRARGPGLWYPSALDERTLGLFPTLPARAPSWRATHGPRATPLVERPDAEPSAEVVRGGLAVVAILELLGALRHGRQRGDGHGPGRGGPEPNVVCGEPTACDRALTTAHAPRWAEKIKPPSSDKIIKGYVRSRRPRSPRPARSEHADADADIGAARRQCEPRDLRTPAHRLRARAQCAALQMESSLTHRGTAVSSCVWDFGWPSEAAKHVRDERSQPAARLIEARVCSATGAARGGGRRAEAARARVGLGRRRDAGGGGGGARLGKPSGRFRDNCSAWEI